MNHQLQNLLTGSFVITVMMVTFSWVGLIEHDVFINDSLDLLHDIEINADDLPPKLLPEIKELEKAERYESKRIGVGASISKKYLAHEKIKSSAHSDFIFKYLLSRDNAVAQFYAIKGMKENKSVLYQHYKSFFVNSNKDIQLISGCSVYIEPVKSVFFRL